MLLFFKKELKKLKARVGWVLPNLRKKVIALTFLNFMVLPLSLIFNVFRVGKKEKYCLPILVTVFE